MKGIEKVLRILEAIPVQKRNRYIWDIENQRMYYITAQGKVVRNAGKGEK